MKADAPNKEALTIDEADVDSIWIEHGDEAKQFLQLLASYYKEERFRGEGEIRAAFLPIYKNRNFKTKISYFEQENGVLRPYMSVCFLHKYPGEDECYQAECPIKSILVGPSGNQQKVYNSIVHRLKYGKVKGWKYNEEQLSKILSEYILECIKRSDEKSSEDYEAIVNRLSSVWCSKNGYRYHVDKATKATVEVRVFVNRDEPIQEKDVNDNAQNISKQYMEDNFLSGDGIWVKKSSLPYNF